MWRSASSCSRLLSDEATTVAFVDDAHLADAASLRALLFAARRLIGCRALVVLAVRGTAAETLPEGWTKLAAGVLARPARWRDRARRRARARRSASTSPPTPPRGCARTPTATRCTSGRCCRRCPPDDAWQYEHRPLPVPRSYAQLVRERLDRCAPEVIELIEAAAVLGVQAPLHLVTALAELDAPLDAVDAAIETGLVTLDDGAVARVHRIRSRAPAVYEALPTARRAALNARAAELVPDASAALRHRVEAATLPDAALLAELEAHAREERARGSWPSAIESLLAASRLSPLPAERERLALEAIEATMYSGDGAAARRLASQADFEDGPRRDSVLAYLAIFAGDVAEAQWLLTRAWEGRTRAGDDRLVGDDRDAQRVPGDLAAAWPRSGRVGRARDRARAGRPRPRPARRAVAGARHELQRRPGGRARRARPLARRPAHAGARRAATSCSRSRASCCSRTARLPRARAALERSATREPRPRAARRRRAVALRPRLRAVSGGRVGRRRRRQRAGDRARGRVRRPVGDRPGALARELRTGRARRLDDGRRARRRDPRAGADVRTPHRRRGDRGRRAGRRARAPGRGAERARAPRPHDRAATACTIRPSCRGSTSRRTRSSTSAAATRPSASSRTPWRSAAAANPLLAAQLDARAREARVRARRRRCGLGELAERARRLLEPLGVPYELALVELTEGHAPPPRRRAPRGRRDADRAHGRLDRPAARSRPSNAASRNSPRAGSPRRRAAPATTPR